MYRLKKGKQLEKEEAICEVKKNIHLIKAPHAGKMFLYVINSTTWQMICKYEMISYFNVKFSVFMFLCFFSGKSKQMEAKMVQKLQEDISMEDDDN